MPRPTTNVEPYREEIINLLQRRHTHNHICGTLNTQYNIQIAPRTLRRRLQSWGYRQTNPISNKGLHARIQRLISEVGLSNTEVLAFLSAENRTPISERTLSRILRKTALPRPLPAAEVIDPDRQSPSRTDNEVDLTQDDDEP